MLGVGSSITSGVAESKYSAFFDGNNGTHIDTGQTFQSLLRGDYSISFWMKPSNGRTDQMIFNAENSSGHDEIYFQLQTDGVPRFVLASNNGAGSTDIGIWNTSGGGGFAFNSGAASSWTHFLIVVNHQSFATNSVINIFVNGVDKTNETAIFSSANQANYTSSTNLVLGARNIAGSLDKFYEGGINEFAIFSNATMNIGDAVAIYNGGSNPLNLTLDQGPTYDNSSALHAYYKMGDGLFDDKVKGVIHDQDDPGFGSTLVTWDGSTTSDWSVAYANTTLSANNGRLRATANGEGSYGVSKSFTTVVGAVYRVDYNINIDNATGSDEEFGVSVNSNLSSQLATLSTSTEIGTGYFTATATTTYIGLVDISDEAGLYLEIESISVKKLNGKPALTSGGVTFSSDTP